MVAAYIEQIRPDLELIAALIKNGSTVLDLGCGNGDLLHKLIHENQVRGHGVEFSDTCVYECVNKGVPVIHADLDEGLVDYPDKSFDYVILSRTLQVINHPDVILKEMLRVGKKCIVSFPNFGFWKIRSQLFFGGKMPITKTLPYQWYDTPNIHLSTIKDFKIFCKKEQIKILDQINIKNSQNQNWLANTIPNYFAELSIFTVQNGGSF